MWILKQTTRSLIDRFGFGRFGRRQQADQDSRSARRIEGDEGPELGLEVNPEYGDNFISRMIQLSQMPRTRSPRDRGTFSVRPVSARPAYGL